MTKRRRIRCHRPLQGQRQRIDPRADFVEKKQEVVPPRSRRDPRGEKTHRVRHEVQTTAKIDRPHRNPRADKGQRLRRELRGQDEVAAPVTIQATRSHHIVESATFWVATVSLSTEPWPEAEAEILGAAKQLAGDTGGVILIRLGTRAGGGDAGTMGADRILQAEGEIETLLAFLATFPARHILFAEGFADGDLARRLGARMDERPAAGVLVLDNDQAVLRGDGGCSDLFRIAPRLMILARNRFDPWEGAPGEARAVPTLEVPEESSLPLLESITLPATNIPLSRSNFILSAGEGVTDWKAFHRLATALGATEGGSRQVCDAGHLPRTRQVGASGTLVEARVYLAFGISGAPQHLQGVQRCRFVLAVNTDLHAAMVKRADLAIIADVQQVMPALIQLMEGVA